MRPRVDEHKASSRCSKSPLFVQKMSKHLPRAQLRVNGLLRKVRTEQAHAWLQTAVRSRGHGQGAGGE